MGSRHTKNKRPDSDRLLSSTKNKPLSPWKDIVLGREWEDECVTFEDPPRLEVSLKRGPQPDFTSQKLFET